MMQLNPPAVRTEGHVACLEARVLEGERPEPQAAADDHGRLVALLSDVGERAVEGGGAEADQCDASVAEHEARLEAISGQAQVVREGDEVDGYTVVEISPSAVVFERSGETVRVRVSGR